jgi:hypothetical protein
VDYARSQHSEKRGAGAVKLALDEALAVPGRSGSDVDLLALNSALDQLSQFDPRQSRIVELRFSPACPLRRQPKSWIFRRPASNANGTPRGRGFFAK